MPYIIRTITVNNVIEIADSKPMDIIQGIQKIIDDANYDIPTEVITREAIIACQVLQSYYANQHAYLIGIWGVLRVFAGTDKRRIAIRDYLSEAASACKLRYAAASRQLSALSVLQSDMTLYAREI